MARWLQNYSLLSIHDSRIPSLKFPRTNLTIPYFIVAVNRCFCLIFVAFDSLTLPGGYYFMSCLVQVRRADSVRSTQIIQSQIIQSMFELPTSSLNYLTHRSSHLVTFVRSNMQRMSTWHYPSCFSRSKGTDEMRRISLAIKHVSFFFFLFGLESGNAIIRG